MTEPVKSILAPVGVASPMTGTPQWTMAVFDAKDVPAGTELYVQPSEGRLKLEVEVANENAVHWRQQLTTANLQIATMRTELYRTKGQLREISRRFNNGTLTAPDLTQAIEGTLYTGE